jgi:hypothetical protein
MKNILILISMLFLPVFALAQSENSYTSGEKLKFMIYYGPIDGGYIDAELKITKLNGKEVYHSKMVAKTTGIADRLYKVRDEYQSYFDPHSVLPYKSIRDISEGKYKKYNIVHYYHSKNLVVNIENTEFEVPSDVRDMVSVFHYIRNIDYNNLMHGDVIKVNTFFDNEIFPFDMRFMGKETITTRKGTFNCIKLVPFVEPGRIFSSEDDMTIWMSDDQNRVPVRVKFNLKVGSIKCDLIEFSGLKH